MIFWQCLQYFGRIVELLYICSGLLQYCKPGLSPDWKRLNRSERYALTFSRHRLLLFLSPEGRNGGRGRGQSEDSREYVLSFLIYFIFGSRKFGRSTARRSTFYVQTCIFGVTDLKLSYFLFLIFHRRHRYKLYLPTSKSNIRPNTYPYRSSSVYMERTSLARN